MLVIIQGLTKDSHQRSYLLIRFSYQLNQANVCSQDMVFPISTGALYCSQWGVSVILNNYYGDHQ